MSDTILYRSSGHVAELILNKPEKHNSLGQDELEAMRKNARGIANQYLVTWLTEKAGSQDTKLQSSENDK